MLSGTFVMAQAAKCRELVDLVRVHGILARLNTQSPRATETAGDPIQQIARLRELQERGALSVAEFGARKAELLNRI
jgi:hypothetical protein